MGRYYMLGDSGVVEEPDHAKWAQWYETTYDKVRSVASTKVHNVTISTVFLAMNMTLARAEPPLLFETRVKGGWLNDQWERYSTLDQAKAGHEAWVARVRAAEDDTLPPPGRPVW